MTVRIPGSDSKFSQPNKGETFGNLNRTLNFDLKTNPGKIRLSSRLTASTKDNDGGISSMGLPVAFAAHNAGSGSRYWAACGIGDSTGSGKILVTGSDSPSVAFVNDTTTNTPSTISLNRTDMVLWDAQQTSTGLQPVLLVSTFGISKNIARLKLAVDSWNTDWFAQTGLSFSTISLINFCPAFNGNLYVMTQDKLVYVAPSTDGTAAPTASMSGSGTIDFKERFYPIWARSASRNLWVSLMSGGGSKDTRGYMGKWNATGTALDLIIDINAPCALSGVVVDDIFYFVDAYGRLKKESSTGFIEVARLPVANQNIEMPGIYDTANNARWIHHRGMSVVDGKININVNNYVSSGVYVEDMPSGVWEFDPAYPELGLYHKESPCAASTDYGQQLIATVGAIHGTKRTTATHLAGYQFYTDSGSTSRYGIFYDDIATNTNKRASFVTPWVSSPNIKDTIQSVSYRFKPLTSGDKIIGKSRQAKKANLPFLASCTWTATNTLTSTTNNLQYASVGDEVEVVMGVGASTTAHISAISSNSGTYTITLDDTIGQSSGSCQIKVNNFAKFITISDTNISEDRKSPVHGTALTKIQVKTELRGTGDFELDDLTIFNTKHE